MSILWRLPFVLGHGVRRHLTVLSPQTAKAAVQSSARKTDGPTVNFRPALVSFSACLLENTDPNSRENNGQLRLSSALEALGTESFPVVLAICFVSAFLSSRFLVFFHPVFPGRWIYFLLLFVCVHCTV